MQCWSSASSHQGVVLAKGIQPEEARVLRAQLGRYSHDPGEQPAHRLVPRHRLVPPVIDGDLLEHGLREEDGQRPAGRRRLRVRDRGAGEAAAALPQREGAVQRLLEHVLRADGRRRLEVPVFSALAIWQLLGLQEHLAPCQPVQARDGVAALEDVGAQLPALGDDVLGDERHQLVWQVAQVRKEPQLPRQEGGLLAVELAALGTGRQDVRHARADDGVPVARGPPVVAEVLPGGHLDVNLLHVVDRPAFQRADAPLGHAPEHRRPLAWRPGLRREAGLGLLVRHLDGAQVS
mmetsp:Transcript_6614/g.18023  ORF Transcript_6614/g.18023 Transcript_6614/m.18023 type:complete len:292 (+) Transcript_6614:475-1350(+)